MGVTRIPALHDAGGTEVDILGVGLAIELRRQTPHDMHPCRTAIAGEFAHGFAVAFRRRQPRRQLVDDMTQPMRLLLARDVTGDATRSAFPSFESYSGGVGEFVCPSVDDGVAIYVVDAGHNALFEFVF